MYIYLHTIKMIRLLLITGHTLYLNNVNVHVVECFSATFWTVISTMQHEFLCAVSWPQAVERNVLIFFCEKMNKQLMISTSNLSSVGLSESLTY